MKRFRFSLALLLAVNLISHAENLWYQDFESGQGAWTITAGVWEIGPPSAGPGSAYDGNNCAGTILNGNYPNNADDSLISPPFVVASYGNQTLSFWHWISFNNAYGFVNISTDYGNTWTQLQSYGSTGIFLSTGWIPASFNLSAYAGQTVEVAFRFVSGGINTAPGWYLDDITLPYDPSTISISAPGRYASPKGLGGFIGKFTVSRGGPTNQPVTVNLTASGTAIAGTDYVRLPSTVSLAANQSSANLTVSVTNTNLSSAKTIVLAVTSGDYFTGLTTNAVVTLIPASSATNSVNAAAGRYWRGTGNNPTYWSTVVPLDYETGTVYSNLNGNCSTLYPGLSSWSSQTLYHYNVTNGLSQTNVANRIPFNNPIVAFGEREGGTPLYFSQPYRFGVYAGDLAPSNQAVVIQAYYRTNYQLAGTVNLYPPTSTNINWEYYTTNGFEITTNGFGLMTMLSGAPDLTWGEYVSGYYIYNNGAYVLTHAATSQATNYYYLVSIGGNPPPSNSNPMVINGSRQIAPSPLYSLDFAARPPWRATFLDQPQFNGSPLPPFYAGMTLAEMLTNTPPVTNSVSTPISTATNLDNSPELRRHPILDSFVANLGNDPIALANYVINQIGLTDPIDDNDNGSVADNSINPGGVTRGALGTFLEKQGSPVEQCALLVYLLRQAGVPAVYEFAPHNGVKMLDARLSQMLKFQVHGADNAAGQLYTTNTMIGVNYPWVAAYIGTNWVHIFPWLKDNRIVEGLDLWAQMPTNYANAYRWGRDYIYGNTNLLSLAVNGDNTPRVIFPRYLQKTLSQNHPGISVDDIGVKIINRQHYYARWQDFPTPTWVTNISTSITNLSSIALTNVNPALTNIFDTLSVEIYSLNDPTKDIRTGDLRLCDLHNREFYIYQSSNSVMQLNLVLMPYRTNITTQYAFTNDASLLSKETLSLTFDANDYQLGVRFRYHRHRAITPATAIDPFTIFLGLTGYNEVDIERPLLVGDQAAICLDYGQVTRDMLNVHAADLWQMQNRLNANPSLAYSISPDVYEGAIMYLAGMSYYEKCSEFEQLNGQLQKFALLSSFSAGLSKILPARDSYGNLTNGTDPVLPSVDMFTYETMLAGNGTLHPDSGQDATMAQWNYNTLGIIAESAEEHQVLNRFYQQTNAVSTVRLLQLAQASGGAGIVELDKYNYFAQGTTSYQGKALQSWDTGMWQQVTNALGLGFVTAYMTPGPVANAAYKGMGALILNPFDYEALISPFNINGGFSGQQLPANTVAAPNTPNYNLTDNNNDYSVALTAPASQTTVVPDEVSGLDAASIARAIASGTFVVDPFTASSTVIIASMLGTASGTSYSAVSQASLASEQQGFLGWLTDAGSTALSTVSDPVHSVTGEFYVNETDLQLPGPIPLALRHNYTSQNLADNQFGRGWKLSIMPYLSLSTGSTNIYAADMDGAVLAYVRNTGNTNLWSPTLGANPQLNNDSIAGVGGLANRLRDYILRSVNGSVTNYTLYGADGGVRVFQWMRFTGGAITNARPYLTKWTDNRGNFYAFSYDTNSASANFGQMRRIQCSNGNYLGFDYDIYGHIIDAYTGDGRWIYYDYDDYGDLVTVTLPDNSTRSYQYQHATQAVTGGTATYSTHLIIEEDKPDGRELINAYDSQRRVTNQLSTAGNDLNPIRTATFIYANNFNITNSYTNSISGNTLIIDGNGNTNRYDYTNSLITKITDPLGQTIQQNWYPDNATAPGFPRSIALIVNKRGMTNQFFYDGNGNITNTIVFGDLTGDGTLQSATNTVVYNTNSLPVQTTDPVGNGMVTIYDPVFNFLPQQVIHYASVTPVSTNFVLYGNVTNTVVNGNVTQTNTAFGLPIRQIRAYGSAEAATNDAAFDGHGLIIQTIRYTGTSDPNITNTFFYNERGQIVDQIDALGALQSFDYDALNRPTAQESFDENNNSLAWSFNYYNDNGEVTWVDGPRYHPEDYVYYDYDGAGRRSLEIHWRTEAKSDGTGVQSPAGYNLYAQSFFFYDPLGNLTSSVDPRGAITTNSYNAIAQLVRRQYLDTNGVTVLSTESFGYEPGGQVAFHTNALGGVTATLYTDTGKPEFRSNPDGSTNAWRYYLDGRLKQEIQGNGAYWQTTYDDANRRTTRIFYSALGTPLATNSAQVDRRGNAIQRVDAGNNTFTTTFDGLDRAKVAAGPAIVTVSSYQDINFNTVYVTNTLQQFSANFYDAAGRSVTNSNALGEKTVTKLDALGRTTSVLTFNASASLAHEEYFAYSADHNSVTVTDGSGASAISHTAYTDPDGHTLLSVAYPSAGVLEYTWNHFDLSGNQDYSEHDASFSGSVVAYSQAASTHDGLNRTTSKTDRDNALTTYAFDGLGNLVNRAMPGGLQWRASYNSAGQMLQEWNLGGSNGTRTNTYAYFSGGSPFAGLLQSKTDGRGVSSVYAYDSWLRATNLASSGALPEQNLTTAWQYEPRGYVTGISEQFSSTNTGPSTSIQRTFDPYGQLASESVNGGTFSYGSGQSWDATGRRTQLNIGGVGYGFIWRADGNLTGANDLTGSGAYAFDTAGVLTNRTVGNRQTAITSRDGEGRPLSIATTVNLSTRLGETLTWSGDGLLASHTLNRVGDFTDSRSYSYASMSRRLAQEQLNLNGSTTWTNNFGYDSGVGAGPGALTQIGGGTSLWNGSADAFSRVSTATNNVVSYLAGGHVNGQATLNGWLDAQQVAISTVGTNAMQWQSTLELPPGTHQLKLAALHPSGQFIAWATNSFTNTMAYQCTADAFDNAGYLTQRIWRNPNGTTNQIQTLAWDARGRLHSVTTRDASNSGYNWTATFDGLDRRLSTATIFVTNGVTFGSQAKTINQYYDPLYEFLELGVAVNNSTTWKLYGPDLNGKYGGLNGTGGLDAISPYLNLFNPIISDFRGNILGEITNGTTTWFTSRPTGYGAVSGYRPPTLGGSGVDLAQASAWRGRWADITLNYQIGMRAYNPVAGGWLAADPLWNERDPNYYSFCGGDPVNGFDSNGKCVDKAIDSAASFTEEFADATVKHGNAFAAWVDDTAINTVVGTGILLNQAAGSVTGDPYFSYQARQAEQFLSPYARKGYYNPNNLGVEMATVGTMLLAPEAAASRFGSVNAVQLGNLDAFDELANAPAATISLPGGLIEEASRLQLQWPAQLGGVGSGVPMAYESVQAYQRAWAELAVQERSAAIKTQLGRSADFGETYGVGAVYDGENVSIAVSSKSPYGLGRVNNNLLSGEQYIGKGISDPHAEIKIMDWAQESSLDLWGVEDTPSLRTVSN